MSNKKYIKNCEVCGKEFSTSWDHTKYCSRVCRNKKHKIKSEERKTKEVKKQDQYIVPVAEINVTGQQEFIGKEIPIIEGGFGDGKRCLTDKAIADIHNMEVKHVRELMNRNINRFKENIDFIDLKVVVENDHNFYLLKNLDFTQMQISKSQHIYLLSERGYAKLIKIMDTDLAWEIHDKLIDEYFTMRKALNRSKEDELVLTLYKGGSRAIEASKELTAIEVEKARIEADKERRILELEHYKKIREEKACRNRKISLTQVVDMLSIEGLTTSILHEWFANIKNLGTYDIPAGEKKRLFQPNEEFIKWVSLEGYAFTGKTIKGNKISVAYSTELIDRIQKQHINSLINYVKLKTEKESVTNV